MITRETIAAIGQKAADCPAQATIFMTEEIEELARVALAADARVSELLEANNAEVARRRKAEIALAALYGKLELCFAEYRVRVKDSRDPDESDAARGFEEAREIVRQVFEEVLL